MVRVDPIDKVGYEQRLEGGVGVNQVDIWSRVFQTEIKLEQRSQDKTVPNLPGEKQEVWCPKGSERGRQWPERLETEWAS